MTVSVLGLLMHPGSDATFNSRDDNAGAAKLLLHAAPLSWSALRTAPLLLLRQRLRDQQAVGGIE